MRVLFLAHSFPRYEGDAAGSFLLQLARALRNEDIGVHVVAPAAPGVALNDVFDGISVSRFHYAPRRYETLAYTGTMADDVRNSWSAKLAMVGFLGGDFAAAVRERRAYSPDVLHAHWWFPGGLVGTWLSSLSSVPLVTTLHGTDARIAREGSPMRPLARHVLQHSALVTTVSRWLSKEVTTIAPSVAPTVAPMPVDTERFVPGGTREAARLLLVGRLNAQKGIGHALRALARMRSSQATLDIVGDGPGRDEYTRLASELGIAARVRFLGQLPSTDLPALYQRATALVVPSIDEGLGLVAVEAQLCETPVVGFESGGLTDAVQHDRTGLLVPPRDVSALADALDTIMERPEYAAALGQAGRLHALAVFAPESVARAYAGIYRGALGRRAA